MNDVTKRYVNFIKVWKASSTRKQAHETFVKQNNDDISYRAFVGIFRRLKDKGLDLPDLEKPEPQKIDYDILRKIMEE